MIRASSLPTTALKPGSTAATAYACGARGNNGNTRGFVRVRLRCSIGVLGGVAASAAQAGANNGNGLVPTTWFCNGSSTPTIFLLPPVTNPKAPFPGFLSTTGQVYVVVAGGPIGSPVPVGQKNGLQANAIDCISYDFNAEVIISPAGQ